MNRRKSQRVRKRLFRTVGTMITLCLLLTGIGTHLIFAQSKALTLGDLIPGSVTIDSPRALSDVTLPKSDYGTLKWKDTSAVPSAYSTSYGVTFTASGSGTADFSKVSGWDDKSRSVSGTVTVYVTSLAPKSTETPAPIEDTSEETPMVTPKVEADPKDVDDLEGGDSKAEIPDVDEEQEKEDASPNEEMETEEQEEPFDDTNKEDKSKIEEISGEVIPGEENQPVDSIGAPAGMPTEEHPVEEFPEASETTEPEAPKIEELPESPMELVEEEVRPESVSEDMTPEERAVTATANHTSQGITVSAEFLPWYVQFRVYDGSGFGFTNAANASTFQAYEFQLWDLLNDVEYTIPEGKSVQVTMPVVAGYEYSIEHVRQDGTIETINPSVYGDTLVFSTSSFSPFGIAGSKPLVGGDIADGSYSNAKPGSASGSSSTSGSTSGNSSSSGNASAGSSSGSASGNSSSSGNASTSSSVSSGSSNNSSGASGSTSDTGSNTPSVARMVKTGDNTNIKPFVFMGLAALIVIIVLIMIVMNKRRK